MSDLKKILKNSDIFSHLSSIGYLPRWMVLLIDLALCAISYIIAYEFAYRYYYFKYENVDFDIINLVIVLFFQSIWFWVFHTYSGIIRYSTFIDAVKLIYAVLSNFITLYIVHYACFVFVGHGIFLRLGIIFYSVIAFVFLFGLRLVVKSLYDLLVIRTGKALPVVVYGTKSAGVAIAKMVRAEVNSRYRIVGFIDDNGNKDKQIFGLPIVSTKDRKNMIVTLTKKKVKGIIVSPLKMKEIDITKDLDVFIDLGFKILVIPTLSQYEDGDRMEHFDVERNLRNIQIEDLLERQPIEIDKAPIRDMISGKVVMITGAAGSIGSELVRQLSLLKPKQLILFDNAETPLHNIKLEMLETFKDIEYAFVIADVRMRDRVERVFEEYKPNVVFHAAAYKHVPMMEDNPSECILANVWGSRNVADMSVKYGVESFVMVSTDKAVNPTNVMGCSKRLAEIYVQSLAKKLAKQGGKSTKFITTRFGNVLGSNGSVIPLFKHQIEIGGPVTVTHPDIIRYFMTIPEACQLVLEAATLGRGGEIFIFDMGMPVKIANLATKMIKLAGLEPGLDIEIKYTGLRPGEKLYEELLNNEELVKPTSNSKIMIASVREYDYDVMLPMIDKLIEYARENEDYIVVRTMKEIVPEYKSQNSTYQQIDIDLKRERI